LKVFLSGGSFYFFRFDDGRPALYTNNSPQPVIIGLGDLGALT